MIEQHGGVINLRPGELYASREPVWIRTVLGSCVSVCLYDQVAGVGGMNHFMLPGPQTQEEESPARYGPEAMKLLIGWITGLGGSPSRLVAKAFGGANVLRMNPLLPSVAEDNIQFIRRFLDEEKIPLMSSRLGGQAPLEVRFFTRSARTLVKALRKRRPDELAALEMRPRAGLDRESK